MKIKRKINCSFPQAVIREPLLYNLGKDFQVIPNIRGASITEEGGFMIIEMEGETPEIERCIAYLQARGVNVTEEKGR